MTFHNKDQLFSRIDALPANGLPDFECEIIHVEGTVLDSQGMPEVEHLELWKRNPVECVREILGNPAFEDALRYEPEKVFTDATCSEQIYNEAWTGEWWWDVQVCY
jgi:hypothetical protein